ncbi:head decoration protein [Candidatus Vondammii sp. HM_W22]|uniref:head decoration protein n=1 Tax=Candidatus Vondammii sp. HM_W22 TaxID=2687299 RepID=UPI002E7B059F|nr:head decoration protein [Candidatus Vondammii sp. HM_W22]
MIAESNVETVVYDNLIAGSVPQIATDDETLITGQNLSRGALVGRITASGKITECDNAALNGSDVPLGIMVHPVNATTADKTCQIYVAGAFHSDELTWHASFDTDPEKLAAFDGTAIVLR